MPIYREVVKLETCLGIRYSRESVEKVGNIEQVFETRRRLIYNSVSIIMGLQLLVIECDRGGMCPANRWNTEKELRNHNAQLVLDIQDLLKDLEKRMCSDDSQYRIPHTLIQVSVEPFSHDTCNKLSRFQFPKNQAIIRLNGLVGGMFKDMVDKVLPTPLQSSTTGASALLDFKKKLLDLLLKKHMEFTSHWQPQLAHMPMTHHPGLPVR